MKSLRNFGTFVLIAAGFVLAGNAAKADSLSIVLDAPFQTGDASVFAFTATITNNSSKTVYLNGDLFYVDSPLTVDDSPYYNNYPLTLGAGDSFTGVLFDVDVPQGTPYGLYNGFFDITGGHYNSSETYVVGTAEFEVKATPEPGSLVLLGSGLLALGGAVRRKLFAPSIN